MIEKKNYIKVTPKGEKRSHVVLAANTAFYKRHGAKIEEPTEDEIMKAFPELVNSRTVTSPEEIQMMRNAVLTATKRISSLEDKLESANQEIARLKKASKPTKN
jgi:hypothetical protein